MVQSFFAMKLERLHEYVMTVVVIAIGLVGAVVFGKLSGTGQMNQVASIGFAVLAGFACLTLRTTVWIFIPLTLALEGQILVLPVPVTARDVFVLAVFGMFLAMKALRLVRIKPAIEAIDLWVIVNVLWVCSEFARHPVGSSSMGSDRVGGRPYFSIVVSVLAYWVLTRANCSPKIGRWLPLGAVGFKGIESILTILCQRYWLLGSMLGPFYSTFNADTRLTAADVNGEFAGPEGESRHVALLAPGQTLGNVLSAYFRPITLLIPLYFIRFLLLTTSLVLIFLSGFRSAFFTLLAWMFVSSYYRRGWGDIIRISLIFCPAVLMLGVLQGTVINLPMAAQRALSFLPGNWSEEAKTDAADSTKWRVDMWKDALFTDKYIQDKILGDGFGVTSAQMNRIMAFQATGYMATTAQGQESMAIVGNFHSGPVSSIRFAGYVGLVLILALFIQSTRVAHRILRRAMGTPFQALALYVCIPVLMRPFMFIFIFGGYGDDLAAALFGIGMLKMLTNSLDAYELAVAANKSKSEWSRPARENSAPGRFRPLPAPIGV